MFRGGSTSSTSAGLTGLCRATTAAASSMAGPLLSLDEAALRCCWWDRRESLEPLEPSELYPWEPPLCTG